MRGPLLYSLGCSSLCAKSVGESGHDVVAQPVGGDMQVADDILLTFAMPPLVRLLMELLVPWWILWLLFGNCVRK